MVSDMGPNTTDQHSDMNDTFSQVVNGTTAPNEKEFPYVIIITILFMSIGLIGNILVLVTTLFSKKIKILHQAFLLSLAVADTLFLSLVMPFVVKVMLDGGWTAGDPACRLQGYMLGTTCHASLCSIASIAINRYVSVVHFSTYKTLFTVRNTALIIACVWFYSLLLPFPTQVGWGKISYSNLSDSCHYDWGYRQSYTITVFCMGYVLPSFVIIYCYLRIWLTFRKSRKNIQSTRNTIHPLNGSHVHISKENLRLAGQLVALFLVFTICWAPYMILAALVDPHGKKSRLTYDITSNLLLFNAVIDPAVYFFFNATLRSEVRVLYRRIFCCLTKESPESRRPTDTTSRC